MRDLAHRIRAQPARPRRSGAAPDAAVAAVLGLQRRAGNAAVTGLIHASRRAIQRQPKTHTFELGEDVSVDFAKQAKSLAKDGTVTAAELPALHTLALKDETVGDAERMFMAGLLDPANAALLAAGKTQGIAQMASGWNVGLMCGAVLASGKNATFKDLTKKINKASTETDKPDDKFLDELFADTNFRPRALRMVADADAVDPGAQTDFEGLKGESVLQTGTP